PELGVHECCRRILGELARVMQLRGAAIVLRDGAAFTHGAFAVEPLRAVWPAAVDTLPGRIIVSGVTPIPLTLRDALEAADAPGAFAIVSPRQRWGHIFVTTSLLGAVYTDEDVAASVVLADQMAPILDSADLLARAVAVERSLAHAEKLAAIGETAARIAHEIRNPVTPAPSPRRPAASRSSSAASRLPSPRSTPSSWRSSSGWSARWRRSCASRARRSSSSTRSTWGSSYAGRSRSTGRGSPSAPSRSPSTCPPA